MTRSVLLMIGIPVVASVVPPATGVQNIGASGSAFCAKATDAELPEQERQRRRAQKLESLGLLASGIAHDLNNILAGIMGYSDLALAELPASEPVRAHIDVIKKAVRRAAELVGQILTYSEQGQIDRRAGESQPDRRGLSRLAEVCCKRAILEQNLAADLPVIAHASQISQVIMNLIINASEALGDLGGVISISTDTIRCSNEDAAHVGLCHNLAEGVYVRLRVIDTGCGMDQQTVAKIFDPFFTTKLAGRGLGLAAVQGIVREHKGAIWVSSEPGKGTVFQLLFPAGDLAPTSVGT